MLDCSTVKGFSSQFEIGLRTALSIMYLYRKSWFSINYVRLTIG